MGRSSEFVGKLLKPAAKENPHREGSASFKTYAILMDAHKKSSYKGVSIEKLKELGVRMNTIRFDVTKNLITVTENG